jgi:hypothetical protein
MNRQQPEIFTDEQVTAACGLHLDNLRRLITWGAVAPVQSGGGRGRVRKWSARQALRISVTAQFVEAGFPLQMAHTLTYCLPLDDLLYAYDPEIIRTHIKGRRDPGAQRLRAMLTGRRGDYWPDKGYYGSEVLIVDRKYLYADVLGDSPTLFAIIDGKRNRVYPTHNPLQFLYGAGMVEDYKLPKVVDARKISRASLLVDDEFLPVPWDEPPPSEESEKRIDDHWKRFTEKLPSGVDSQVLGIDRLVCRNFVAINLAVGLTIFVRRLLGLPVEYHPFEEPSHES